MSKEDLNRAYENLVISIMKQYGKVPSEIQKELDDLELLINPTTSSEEVPGPEAA